VQLVKVLPGRRDPWFEEFQVALCPGPRAGGMGLPGHAQDLPVVTEPGGNGSPDDRRDGTGDAAPGGAARRVQRHAETGAAAPGRRRQVHAAGVVPAPVGECPTGGAGAGVHG
jgi:hypothetical protein